METKPNIITNQPTAPITPTKKSNKIFKVLVSILSILLIIVSIIGTALFFFVFIPAQKMYRTAQSLQTDVEAVKVAINNKDLADLKIKISTVSQKTDLLKSQYDKFAIAKVLPYVKDYYADGLAVFSISKSAFESADILIKAVEPYQDFLGLKGSSTSGEQTAEDRIAFLTESVESLVPHFDTLEAKISDIERNLNTINPDRYPEVYNDIEIRQNIFKVKEIVAEAHKFLKDGKPILTKTSWLLGKDSPRNYLLLFQNDAELRPTGGFWTAYATVKVDKGKITPLSSDDIYTLDGKINSTIPAPRPIKAYHINVPYWNVRDMNISPDFPTSVELFLQNYQKAFGSKTKIDAVVAIDTQVLVDIVKVIGRVGVGGYGNFDSTPDKRCDGCPNIIYQLEWIAGRPRNYIELNRKGFLGPLMNQILANAMGAEKSKIAPLVEAGVTNIIRKHVLFYFTDKSIQEAAVLANIAGSIVTPPQGTDYFHLNDANMSSAKTNLFLTQKIKHEIRNNNGTVEHKVTVTYTNPSRASNCNLEKGDLCLNAPKYRNWFRFYVPTGSKMVKMTGTEVDPVLYEELGKQVFEGFYGNKYPLYALNSTKVSIQYQSSVPASNNYSLYLQKQPGTKAIDYEIWSNGVKVDTFSWVSDKTIKLAL